ncbi:MAG TPA: NAD-dependent epimerase/dehydratase family protein [Vicinamibacteria bacterium]
MTGHIAVTGASGFVGRALLHRAVKDGWKGVGIVRSAASARRVSEAGGRPVVLPGLEAEALAGSLAGCTAVAHLAQIGAERDARYEDVNVGGTRAVIAACRLAGVRRIVFFSGLGVAHYGMRRRCTNPYFLSKLTAEVELYRSGLEVRVFRPSYVVGPGDGFVTWVTRDILSGCVELPGDGCYRMQPIGVDDAAAVILASATGGPELATLDLVGPEPLAARDLVSRLAAALGLGGRAIPWRIEKIALEAAERAASSGGFHGMLPDELDCLLCDEVGEHGPLEELLGRPLLSVDSALRIAVTPRAV